MECNLCNKNLQQEEYANFEFYYGNKIGEEYDVFKKAKIEKFRFNKSIGFLCYKCILSAYSKQKKLLSWISVFWLIALIIIPILDRSWKNGDNGSFLFLYFFILIFLLILFFISFEDYKEISKILSGDTKKIKEYIDKNEKFKDSNTINRCAISLFSSNLSKQGYFVFYTPEEYKKEFN